MLPKLEALLPGNQMFCRCTYDLPLIFSYLTFPFLLAFLQQDVDVLSSTQQSSFFNFVKTCFLYLNLQTVYLFLHYYWQHCVTRTISCTSLCLLSYYVLIIYNSMLNCWRNEGLDMFISSNDAVARVGSN